uniref:C2 domain-containing protein n=1 Tax=Kalanchoe fedtschenkoi TaxID=63787 RepID=A0A7N0VFT2_KALFE
MATSYELEVTIKSAKDLKNVNWRNGQLKPYAVVWIDAAAKCSTDVDPEGDTDPAWDKTLSIPFRGPIEDATLFIDIVHFAENDDVAKPFIGSAKLRLQETVDEVGFGESETRTLRVRRPSDRPQGKIEVKVKVNRVGYRPLEPTSYYNPNPYAAPYSAAPPAPYGNPSYPGSYSAAPPATYGNPYYAAAPAPEPAAYRDPYYAAPPQAATAVVEGSKKKSGLGAGLAVGAVAGVLGGLALAEGVEHVEDKIADDVAERIDDF